MYKVKSFIKPGTYDVWYMVIKGNSVQSVWQDWVTANDTMKNLNKQRRQKAKRLFKQRLSRITKLIKLIVRRNHADY